MVDEIIKQRVGIEVFLPMFLMSQKTISNWETFVEWREIHRNLRNSIDKACLLISFVWFSDASRPRVNAFTLLANASVRYFGVNKKM